MGSKQSQKMEATCSSEMLALFQQAAEHCNPEDRTVHLILFELHHIRFGKLLIPLTFYFYFIFGHFILFVFASC
jgi:hypothetical protein